MVRSPATGGHLVSNVIPFTRDQRRSTRAGRGMGTRARTESSVRFSRRELDAGRIHLELVDASGRPLTRGDCADAPRPCPWVGCSHNLFLDVTDAESIKFNFPDLEPDEVPPEKSCALDVADQGGATLEDVACTMNVTRERVRQVEEKAIQLLRQRSRTRGTAAKVLGEFSDAPADAIIGTRGNGSGSVFSSRVEGAPRDEDDFAADEPPTRISFFAEPDSERVDELVAGAVWNIFAKDSTARGFDCRSRQSISASKRLAAKRQADGVVPKAPTHIEEEKPMKKEDFAVAHAAFKKEHGRIPSALELFETVGEADAKSLSNVRQAIKRAGLVIAGARGPNGSGLSAVAVERRTAPLAARKQALAAEARPSRTTSRDPIVSALITKRDELRRTADAVDVAIEALSVAL